MGTQAQQIWSWIGNNLWTIIIALSLFIQIAPIKINPWSAIIKWVGKLLMNETYGKMDSLITKINSMEKEMKENEKDRIRWEVLDFANSCRNNHKHTKDEFEHIVTLNQKYRRLLQETNDGNGVFEIEYEYIQKLYTERLERNDFL